MGLFLFFLFLPTVHKEVRNICYFNEESKIEKKKKTKSMFGNCFFSLFSVVKNNFLFLRLKNLFDNSKWVKNKNCFQNSIYEGN